MQLLKTLLDYFLHLDTHLAVLTDRFGIWIYILIFAVIFMETGLVVTPFLPGDSLLFAAGSLASLGSLEIIPLYLIILVAAILGDSVNYWIGHYIGPKAFKINNRFLKKEHLEKTQAFYKKHGPKAIVLSRFVPIIRTFAPFVAGVGTMHYGQFMKYNVLGGFLWVTIFTFAGYFFGKLPFVKENFHYVVVLIILISIVPIFIQVWKEKRSKK
ncbi:MAG: DedA family protein [Candidatus Dojkabacteria bacterium]